MTTQDEVARLMPRVFKPHSSALCSPQQRPSLNRRDASIGSRRPTRRRIKAFKTAEMKAAASSSSRAHEQIVKDRLHLASLPFFERLGTACIWMQLGKEASGLILSYLPSAKFIAMISVPFTSELSLFNWTPTFFVMNNSESIIF